MIDSEKRGFKDMMTTMANIYSKPEPTQDTLRIWWAKLNQYEFMQVSRAFDHWVDSNKYMPNIADVLETIKAQKPKEFIKALPRHFTEQELLNNHERMKKLAQDISNQKSDDPKAWARKIINDYDKGKYKLEIGVKFAREALKSNRKEKYDA